jgi:inner membrane protein
VDPVCHTLVGAALGRAGFARRSALGMTALVLGANLPDIDVLAHFGGSGAALEFRRGLTHGVAALLVLPAVFAGALIAVHALGRRLSRTSLPSAMRPRELLLLSYVAVLTHPVLDTLNTYGVRWLMPFSERWFYGDTLFIVDPWVWLMLAAGLYFGRRRRAKTGFRVNPAGPPRLALAGATAYMVVMAVSGRIAERIVEREVSRGGVRQEVMVAPRPITPFTRAVVVAHDDRYITGTFRWLGTPHLVPGSVREFPRGAPDDPDVRAALQAPSAQQFLRWARFPTFHVRRAESGGRAVDIVDLRYASTPRGFGVLTMPVGPQAVRAGEPRRFMVEHDAKIH